MTLILQNVYKHNQRWNWHQTWFPKYRTLHYYFLKLENSESIVKQINCAKVHCFCSSVLYPIKQSIDEPNLLSMNSKNVPSSGQMGFAYRFNFHDFFLIWKLKIDIKIWSQVRDHRSLWINPEKETQKSYSVTAETLCELALGSKALHRPTFLQDFFPFQDKGRCHFSMAGKLLKSAQVETSTAQAETRGQTE